MTGQTTNTTEQYQNLFQYDNPSRVGRIVPFEGSFIEEMPRIFSQNLVPLSVADVFQTRSDVLHDPYRSYEAVKAWWDSHIATADALIYSPDGKRKIVLFNELFQDDDKYVRFLQQLGTHSKLSNAGLILPDGIDKEFEGIELTEAEIERYNGVFNRQQALENRILRILSRHPDEVRWQARPYLLSDYTSCAYALARERHNMDYKIKVFTELKEALPKDATLMTFLLVSSHTYGSGVDDRNGLDAVTLIGMERWKQIETARRDK